MFVAEVPEPPRSREAGGVAHVLDVDVVGGGGGGVRGVPVAA